MWRLPCVLGPFLDPHGDEGDCLRGQRHCPQWHPEARPFQAVQTLSRSSAALVELLQRQAGSGLDRVLSGRAPCQQESGGREVKEGQVQASSERLPRRAPGWTVAWVWSWVLGAAVSKGLDRWLGGVT